jgi:flagellar protein FlbD
MIGLTRLNGRPLVVNAELIETVEATPDTVVSLTNGKKFVVLEDPEEVVERVVRYRRRAGAAAPGEAACGGLLAAEPISHHED